MNPPSGIQIPTILIIEDDEDDFVIVQDLLKELPERMNVCWERTYESGLQALVSKQFAACLLDHRLGAKTGIDLLLAARSSDLLTPVILLTGTDSSDVDRQASRAGAADYIAKGTLTLPVLERSLRYAQERARQIEATRKSERELKVVIESLPIGIFICVGMQIQYVNPCAMALLGYASGDKLTGLLVTDILHSEDHLRFQSRWDSMEGGQKGGGREEFRCLTKNVDGPSDPKEAVGGFARWEVVPREPADGRSSEGSGHKGRRPRVANLSLRVGSVPTSAQSPMGPCRAKSSHALPAGSAHARRERRQTAAMRPLWGALLDPHLVLPGPPILQPVSAGSAARVTSASARVAPGAAVGARRPS